MNTDAITETGEDRKTQSRAICYVESVVPSNQSILKSSNLVLLAGAQVRNIHLVGLPTLRSLPSQIPQNHDHLSFSDWPTIFPNAGSAIALIDRLVHHAEILTIEGDSYRRWAAEATRKWPRFTPER